MLQFRRARRRSGIPRTELLVLGAALFVVLGMTIRASRRSDRVVVKDSVRTIQVESAVRGESITKVRGDKRGKTPPQ